MEIVALAILILVGNVRGNGGGQGEIGLIEYYNPRSCHNYDTCDFYFRNFRITDNTGTVLHEVSTTYMTPNKQTVDLRDLYGFRSPFDVTFTTESTFTISMEVWDFNNHPASNDRYQTITGVQLESFSKVKYFTNYKYFRHSLDQNGAYLTIGLKIMSCDGHYTVPGCEQCAENWYPADNCTVYCEPDPTRYTCSNTGVKECNDHYFGSDCTIYCVPDPKRYDCSSEGVKECKEHFFGSDCTVNCVPDPERYDCSSEGVKECKEHYFGSDCIVYCEPDPARYNCSIEGVKECKEHYFGSDCIGYCEPDLERYGCSSEGVKECKDNYFGSDCTVNCIPNSALHICSQSGELVCKDANRNLENECQEEKGTVNFILIGGGGGGAVVFIVIVIGLLVIRSRWVSKKNDTQEDEQITMDIELQDPNQGTRQVANSVAGNSWEENVDGVYASLDGELSQEEIDPVYAGVAHYEYEEDSVGEYDSGDEFYTQVNKQKDSPLIPEYESGDDFYTKVNKKDPRSPPIPEYDSGDEFYTQVNKKGPPPIPEYALDEELYTQVDKQKDPPPIPEYDSGDEFYAQMNKKGPPPIPEYDSDDELYTQVNKEKYSPPIPEYDSDDHYNTFDDNETPTPPILIPSKDTDCVTNTYEDLVGGDFNIADEGEFYTDIDIAECSGRTENHTTLDAEKSTADDVYSTIGGEDGNKNHYSSLNVEEGYPNNLYSSLDEKQGNSGDLYSSLNAEEVNPSELYSRLDRNEQNRPINDKNLYSTIDSDVYSTLNH